MNKIYSNHAYKYLISFHILYPIILFFIGILLIGPMLIIYAIPLFLIVIAISILGLTTVVLQRFSVKWGYLILIALGTEIYLWINILSDGLSKTAKIGDIVDLNNIPQIITKYGIRIEPLSAIILCVLLLSIFVHTYIAFSISPLTSKRKIWFTSQSIFWFLVIILSYILIFGTI